MDNYNIKELFILRKRLEISLVEQLKVITIVKNTEDYLKEKENYEKVKYLLSEVKKRILMSFKNYLTDGEIDLKRKSLGLEYSIFRHVDHSKIGKIEYRGYHCDEKTGDIGYHILSEYRGNSYALKALKVISNHLNEIEIPDFWISVREYNIPSIKTIERFNGKVLGKSFDFEGDIIMYQCSTKKRVLTH